MTATIPYQTEVDDLNKRIREIEGEIDNFLDAIAKSGSKVISLLEKRIEKLKYEHDELKKRKGELQAMIANSPSKINAQIVLDALRDFSELFDSLNPTERAEYLQRIVRDIVITEDKILINIFGLSKPPSGALNERNVWLPARTRTADPVVNSHQF